MHLTVRLGEPYWRQAGLREADFDLSPGATVRDLLGAVEARFPSLLQGDVPPTVFIDDRVVENGEPLRDGAAATLVWAIAGG